VISLETFRVVAFLIRIRDLSDSEVAAAPPTLVEVGGDSRVRRNPIPLGTFNHVRATWSGDRPRPFLRDVDRRPGP